MCLIEKIDKYVEIELMHKMGEIDNEEYIELMANLEPPENYLNDSELEEFIVKCDKYVKLGLMYKKGEIDNEEYCELMADIGPPQTDLNDSELDEFIDNEMKDEDRDEI